GTAISPAESPAVATWYSSGWKVWWFLRSTTVTRTGSLPSARAAFSPPNPAPSTSTCGRLSFCDCSMGQPFYRLLFGFAERGGCFSELGFIAPPTRGGAPRRSCWPTASRDCDQEPGCAARRDTPG